MTAEIIWDFTALRHAQIEAEKNERAAEDTHLLHGGDADLIYYCSPSKVELPSDSEPA